MERITLVLLAVSLAALSVRAQGLVNFVNTQTTPVYVQEPDETGAFSIMNAPAWTFRFGLFLGQPNASWLFTGIYATNTGVNGLFNGGVVPVPGWAPGTSTNYFVAGWVGPGDFQGQWLRYGAGLAIFGVSGIGTGVAGNGSSIPALNLFGGGTGSLDGFQLYNHLVPEPSSAAIGIVGTGLLLLRSKRTSAL